MSKENKIPPQNNNQNRLIVIALGVMVLFATLIVQFYNIQIVEGEKWTRVADRQHYFVVKEPFLRGKFISNNSIKRGHPEAPQYFVMDIQKFHLHADPEFIPPSCREEIASSLGELLSLFPEEQIELRQQITRKSRNRRLAMWLDRETCESIKEWWQGYAKEHKIPRNALFFVTDYLRSYPFGKLLGQVLHTIQREKDVLTSQAIPTGGLELYFNESLKGKQGKRRLMRSPRNAFETGEMIEAPENGADVTLTINHFLQAIAEEEIAKGVEKCKAKGGWAVMMEPRTGEILALAQYPFFYPSDYQDYFNDPLLIEYTRLKAVSEAHEPGSVLKPFTLAIGLLANEELRKRGKPPLLNPEEKVATSDSRFPGRSKPLVDTHLHYFLNMYMALQKSSNIYMARLIEKVIAQLGSDFYRSALQDIFGFGKKTNIEFPYENPGILPTPGKKHPNGTLEWSVPTPFLMAIGHNIQANSIQLLRAYAIIANGGFYVQPTFVRKVVKTLPDGTQEVLMDHTDPKYLRSFPRVLNPKITKEVVKALKYVTQAGGSARRADIWGYTEAGKSSTAQKIVNGTYSETLYCSSFIGFAPAEKPAFVLLVSMDEPEYGYVPGIGKKHHGGHCAAPVFCEIATRSLEYLGIAPDDPHGYPTCDPRFDPNKAVWVQENRRLKEIYEKWNNKTE